MKKILAVPGLIIMAIINVLVFVIPMAWLVPGWINKFKNPGPVWKKSFSTLMGIIEGIDAKLTAANMTLPIPVQFLILVLVGIVVLIGVIFLYLIVPLFIIELITSIAFVTAIPTIDMYNVFKGERYPLTGIEWYVKLDFTFNFPGMEAAAFAKKDARAQKVAADDFKEYEENRKLYEKYYNEEQEKHGYTKSIGSDSSNGGNSGMSMYEKALIRMQYSVGDHFTKSQLKRRYRKLAAITHPDGEDGSNKNMIELTDAYEYLVPYADEDEAE